MGHFEGAKGAKNLQRPHFYLLITKQDDMSVSMQSLRTKLQPDFEKSGVKANTFWGLTPKPEMEIVQYLGGFVDP